jgi:hypothetical protein
MTDQETIEYQNQLIEKLFATCVMLTEGNVAFFSIDDEIGEAFKKTTAEIAAVASNPTELIAAYRSFIEDLDIKKVFLGQDSTEKIKFCFQLASTYYAISKLSTVEKMFGVEGDA